MNCTTRRAQGDERLGAVHVEMEMNCHCCRRRCAVRLAFEPPRPRRRRLPGARAPRVRRPAGAAGASRRRLRARNGRRHRPVRRQPFLGVGRRPHRRTGRRAADSARPAGQPAPPQRRPRLAQKPQDLLFQVRPSIDYSSSPTRNQGKEREVKEGTQWTKNGEWELHSPSIEGRFDSPTTMTQLDATSNLSLKKIASFYQS